MKSLQQYIQEKLIIKKGKGKIIDYKYFPETKEELKDIIWERIEAEGNEVNLNDIDVSKITDMSYLFEKTNFNESLLFAKFLFISSTLNVEKSHCSSLNSLRSKGSNTFLYSPLSKS